MSDSGGRDGAEDGSISASVSSGSASTYESVASNGGLSLAFLAPLDSACWAVRGAFVDTGLGVSNDFSGAAFEGDGAVSHGDARHLGVLARRRPRCAAKPPPESSDTGPRSPRSSCCSPSQSGPPRACHGVVTPRNPCGPPVRLKWRAKMPPMGARAYAVTTMASEPSPSGTCAGSKRDTKARLRSP